jgi:hypothetical protein
MPAPDPAGRQAITFRQSRINNKEWQFFLQVAQFQLNKAESL